MILNCWKFKGWKSKGRTVCAIALVSFAACSAWQTASAGVTVS